MNANNAQNLISLRVTFEIVAVLLLKGLPNAKIPAEGTVRFKTSELEQVSSYAW